MTLNGHAYRQQMWAPAIGGIAGGVLPTPTTHDTRRRGVNSEQRGLSNTEDWLTQLPTPKAGDGERGRDKARARPDTKGRELATVIRDRMLPTPQARDYKRPSQPESARMQRKLEQGYSPSLEEALLMLPTPRTCSAMAARLDTPGNLEGEQFPNLETVIAREILPTPTTNDSKNASLPPSQAERDGLAGAMLRDDSIPTGAATYLNPSFVEEMMGFPVGWTA